MNDVGLREGDGDVAVGMRGLVAFQLQRGTVERQRLVRRDDLGRNRRFRRRREVEVPILDPLRREEVLAGVFMGEDGRTLRVQPLIAVGMIEVPMRVDQMLDRIGAEAVCGFENPRAGRGDPGVDEHLAVAAGQDGDVAARALENADIAAQLVDLDRRLRRVVADQLHEVARLGQACDGLSQPPVAAKAVAAAQQMQKPRRDITC